MQDFLIAIAYGILNGTLLFLLLDTNAFYYYLHPLINKELKSLYSENNKGHFLREMKRRFYSKYIFQIWGCEYCIGVPLAIMFGAISGLPVFYTGVIYLFSILTIREIKNER